MKVTSEVKRLHLAYTFTTARNSSDFKDNVFVTFAHEGVTGYGEAAPNVRYGETTDSALAAIGTMSRELPPDPRAYEPFLRRVTARVEGEYAAKAAISTAVLDWVGKRLDVPLYRLWGLDPADMPSTSITIGIDEPAVMAEKTRKAKGFPFLKIKVGTDRDREMVAAVRGVTDRPLRVDGNEGWRDRERAAREIEWLAGQGVELVEQPMPAAQFEDMVWLKGRSALPLYADESFLHPSDMPGLAEAFHGINIKLMKCGGLLAAREAVTLARAAGMRLMMGCMIESSVAIAAAAQIGSAMDVLDLDGNHLLTDDPFVGVPLRDGRLMLSEAPGIGVNPLGTPSCTWHPANGIVG